MNKNMIPLPEQGTYKRQLFNYWMNDFHQTKADHSAYIALNFAGALDNCRTKWHRLMQRHTAHQGDILHNRAIARLQNTLSGAAVAYESSFH